MLNNSKNKYIIKKQLLSACLVAVLGAYGIPALAAVEADDEFAIDEIIVTATKRETTLQDVALSISVLSEEMISNSGITSVQNLSSMVAGLDANNQGPGLSNLTIRGITNTSDSFFVNSTVGFYVDEIPVAGDPLRSPELSLFDAQRVEVLRGPQGTLFGDGSLGGTIRVITNKPDSKEFSGRAVGTYSSWDGGGDNYELKGVINIPVIEDKLAFRVSGSYKDDGGYIDNELPGTLIEDITDINTYESKSVRAALRATPNEDLTIDLVYRYSDLDVNDIREEQSPSVKNRNILEPNTNVMNSGALTIEYNLGWASFVSASAYTDIVQTNAHEITDFVITPFFPGMCPSGFGFSLCASSFDFMDDIQTFTQEMRLVSSGDGPLNWTIGGFYRNDERHEFEDLFTFPDDISPLFFGGVKSLDIDFVQSANQYAAFGEFDYQMGDINLLVGGRYYKETKTSTNVTGGALVAPANSTTDDSNEVFIPKAVIKYTPSSDFTAYVSYSEGFRAGGVNALASAAKAFDPSSNIPDGYGPEELRAWELGLKKIWMDGRVRTNLFLYRNSWKDMIQDFIDVGNFGFTDNAGDAVSKGFEIELAATPMDGLNIAFNISHNDATFSDDIFDPVSGAQLVIGGNLIPGMARWSYNSTLEYRYPIGEVEGLFWASFSHRGRTFSEVANSEISKTDNLDILNLRIGVAGDQWGVYLFGNNMTQERGAVLAFPPLNPSFNAVDATFVSPRELGVELRFNF